MKSLAHPKSFLVATLVFGLLGSVHAADPAGKWTADFDGMRGPMKYSYELKTDNGKITGSAIRDMNGEVATNEIADGNFTNNDISFTEKAKIQDQDIDIVYTGTISNDEMQLTRKVGDYGSTNIVVSRVVESSGPVALAGSWHAEFDSGVGHQVYTYQFKLDGDKITGTTIRDVDDAKTTNDITAGKLTGSDLTFTEDLKVQDQDLEVQYAGKVNGDEIKMTRQVGELATNDVVATRVKDSAAK